MTSHGPTHVLHVRIVTGTGGGPEKTILESPRHLEGTRYRESACWLHAPGDPGIALLEAKARERACPFLAIEDPHPYDLRTLLRLAALCREQDVRIWHGHDYKSNLFGVLLAKLCDLKLVTTVHGWVKHTEKTPLYFAVDRFALRRYGEVVAVSQDLFDECLRIGVPSDRLTLIENAIDSGVFRRSRAPRESPLRESPPRESPPRESPPRESPPRESPPRESPPRESPPRESPPRESPLSESPPRESPLRDSPLRDSAAPRGSRLLVGAVGRLSEEKGFHFLIGAVERAVDAGCDLELWIAGEGDQEERLRAQIAASRHGDRLKLLGFRSDNLALFEAFDLFALSSIREGLPNVVLEAMAMEVPVLATRCGGMEAFARDGEDALLVDAGSAEALADGLVRLTRDPTLRVRLARTARRRIETEQSFASRMKRFVGVYDRLLGGS